MNKTSDKKFSCPRHLVLIGMMGVGKTSIGRALAERLRVAFIDSDHAIERHAGKTVAKIFADEGEAAFRETERVTVAQLLDKPPCVLSLGGGAFLDPRTRALIKERAISIWLKVDPALIAQRLKNANSRPLLSGENPEEKINALLAARTPLYALADLSVTCNNRPICDNAEKIMGALYAAQALQTEPT